MQLRSRGRLRATAAALGAVVLLAALSSCAANSPSTVQGHPSLENAADAHLDVVGVDPQSSFDTTAQNALSDVMSFWKVEFPKISGGRSLTPLKGGLYSVDGSQVIDSGALPTAVRHNACARADKAFVVDNGAFCRLDDSIAWDRAPQHLFAQLAAHYGPFVVALIFAHEFGHAISYRLGVFNQDLPTIDTESQADCAAGAWAASALKNQDPHFLDVTPQTLDDALEGFLDGRDSVPGSPDDISHGNGFDRLSAISDGLAHGVTYCYSPHYFDRTFTERPYNDGRDGRARGNTSLANVISPNAAEVTDLNRYWSAEAESIGKTFTPVKIAEAAHPACGAASPASQFGYCPEDNTVYFSDSFAHSAYYSLPGVAVDHSTANVTLTFHQPADFALGELFSIGWGLAVRHQLFAQTMVDKPALLAAVCYTGSYAKDVNIASDPSGTRSLILSPSDLDEAVSGLLDQAGSKAAFGSRDTTGLARIDAFVKGYNEPLSSC